ncbi:MAG: glycosyltransferase family 2 protein [Bacteroidales bacterium]|nr:glycosyltransferase family 2 protein [Bacteroidales bacterium]
MSNTYPLSLSFVIPAYNAEKTITRTLDSIFRLTLDRADFEVVVVDDCSKDNTPAVIEAYASSHPNVVLLRQPENHRQGAARNRGIAAAKGEYIAFVDADDEVAEGLVVALKKGLENKVDMVLMGIRHLMNGKFAEEFLTDADDGVMDAAALFEKYTMDKWSFWVHVWTYLWQHEFLDKVNRPFVEDMLFEDTDFLWHHLLRAQRVTTCSDVAYLYFQTQGSTARTLDWRHLSDHQLLIVRIMQEVFPPEHASEQIVALSHKIKEERAWKFKELTKIHMLTKLDLKALRRLYANLDAHCDRASVWQAISTTPYLSPAKTSWVKLFLHHKHLTISLAYTRHLLREVKYLFKKKQGE